MRPDAPEPFGVLDVIRDAARAFAAGFGAHVRWMLGLVVLGLAATMILGLAFGIVSASVGGYTYRGALALGLVVLMAGASIFLGAIHQGTVLAFTRAARSEAHPEVAPALGEALERVPALAIPLAIRVALDAAVPIATTIAAGVLSLGLDEHGLGDLIVGLVTVTGWASTALWMIVVRASLGMSAACAMHERTGPIASMVRSHRLLAGCRGRLVGVRLAWLAIAAFVIAMAYLPILAWAIAAGIGGFDGGLFASLVLSCAALGFYAVLLLAYSFDTVLEDAFYVRATRVRSAASVASVFE